MKFDDFLHTINDFGRYQKLRYIFICLTYMLPPIMVYTWSFTAAKPTFRCRLSENDIEFNSNSSFLFNQSQPDETYCTANMKISVKECQRCYRKTISDRGTAQIQALTELVGPKNKFLTAISVKYFFAIGQLVLVAFAYFIREWRRLSWALSIFTTPFIFFHFILPESARWMMSKRHYIKAEKLLRHIAITNKRPFDKQAFEQLKNEQEKSTLDQSHHMGILGLFQTKIMFIISMNLFFQWFVQNLVFYGVSQNTGSWGFNPYLSFTMSALVEILSCIVLHPLLNRVGRKLPYFIAAICFAVITLIIIPIQNIIIKNSEKQRILTFILNVLLKFFAAGSYNIIYIYANELFPTRIRNTGMGVCSMIARIGAIVGTTSNDMLSRVWINLPSVLYGILSLIAALSVLILPETLNKNLPQTIEDTEQMGLVCIPIFGTKRESKMEEEQCNKKEHICLQKTNALKSTSEADQNSNQIIKEK
ncbi:unnamed protein product [Rotaria socialis]|uniref:Major facilitator superfamily (MFS) profile domain-containing protein n=1 Tax=Rotaria socialis TaxID=392032 RepID=A0A820V2P9_9BILA|nr:unnamed protein product [Rotaria socialis]